jgi:predicted transcriptional regulator
MGFRLPSPHELRELRRRAGLTQKQLASRAGVSQALIARIEAGKVDPSLSTLRRILAALGEGARSITAREAMRSPVICIEAERSVRDAVEIMEMNAISQLPVLSGGEVVGSLQEATLIKLLASGLSAEALLQKRVRDVMEAGFAQVDSSTPLEALMPYLVGGSPAVLVTERGRLAGIITKIDVLRMMARAARGET